MPEASVKEVMTFFGMSANDFMKDWKKLSPADKAALKEGIGNGTLTY